jgi:hypothetical protein
MTALLQSPTISMDTRNITYLEKFYMYGGITVDDYSHQLWILDPLALTWLKIIPTVSGQMWPFPLVHHAVNCITFFADAAAVLVFMQCLNLALHF